MKVDEKNIIFNKRVSIEQIEEGKEFCPKFNEEGLIPCITIEYRSKEVLMFSFLNQKALKKSIATEKAHYYSRSRKNIWFKGEVSGMYHQIQDILIDDDQDSVIFIVKLNEPTKGGKKASCHVGYKSCFYRKIEAADRNIALKFIENKKSFDPKIVYKDIKNPTKI